MMKHKKIHLGVMGYYRHVYAQYCTEARTHSFMDSDLATELLKWHPELRIYFCNRCLFWLGKEKPFRISEAGRLFKIDKSKRNELFNKPSKKKGAIQWLRMRKSPQK